MIFCTLPLFVDLTKTLLDIFEAYGSAFEDLLRLVIRFFHAVSEGKVRALLGKRLPQRRVSGKSLVTQD